MDSLNQIIFDDKSFSDLLKEIHGNQKKKATQLASLIAELRPLVQSLGDATVVVPLIKEYMEISIKNDDHLIKMAAIVQRLSSGAANSGDSGLLTTEEMDQLMDVAEEIAKTVEKPKQIETPKE
jgi:methyl-accepting chemotaxis protein